MHHIGLLPLVAPQVTDPRFITRLITGSLTAQALMYACTQCTLYLIFLWFGLQVLFIILDTMKQVATGGGCEWIVSLLDSDHTVMANEGLIATSLLIALNSGKLISCCVC